MDKTLVAMEYQARTEAGLAGSPLQQFLEAKARVSEKLEERIMQERLKAKPGSCMARHGARKMERQLRLSRRPGRALRMVGQ